MKPPAPRSLALPKLSTTVGDSVEVPVQLDEGKGVASLQFVLSYDAAILSFLGVKGGPLLTDHVVASEGGKGKLGISISSKASSSMNPGAGTIVVLGFKAVVEGASALTASGASGVDLKGAAIQVSGAQGGVTGNPPPPEPRALALPKLSTTVGDSVEVPVQLDEGKGVASLQFVLSYDAAILSFLGVKGGPLLTDHVVASEGGKGKLGISISSKASSSMNPGAGTIVVLGFKAVVEGASALTASGASGVDLKGAAIQVSGAQGGVTVNPPGK